MPCTTFGSWPLGEARGAEPSSSISQARSGGQDDFDDGIPILRFAASAHTAAGAARDNLAPLSTIVAVEMLRLAADISATAYSPRASLHTSPPTFVPRSAIRTGSTDVSRNFSRPSLSRLEVKHRLWLLFDQRQYAGECTSRSASASSSYKTTPSQVPSSRSDPRLPAPRKRLQISNTCLRASQRLRWPTALRSLPRRAPLMENFELRNVELAHPARLKYST